MKIINIILLVLSFSIDKVYCQSFFPIKVKIYYHYDDMIKEPDSVQVVKFISRDTKYGIDSFLLNIDKFKNLEGIIISNIDTLIIPSKISNLEKIYFIEFSFNKYLSGLNNLSVMRNLQYLELSHNNIKNIPKDIDKLEKLEILVLNGNNIEEMPFALSKMQSLRKLFLDWNIELKPFQLPNSLEQLNMFGCENIKDINWIVKQKQARDSLSILDLGRCKISELPKKLEKFGNLRLFMAQQNKIQKIKCNFSKMKNLEVLYLYNNLIPTKKKEQLKNRCKSIKNLVL